MSIVNHNALVREVRGDTITLQDGDFKVTKDEMKSVSYEDFKMIVSMAEKESTLTVLARWHGSEAAQVYVDTLISKL